MNIPQVAAAIAKTAWDTGRVEARDVSTIELAAIDAIREALKTPDIQLGPIHTMSEMDAKRRGEYVCATNNPNCGAWRPARCVEGHTGCKHRKPTEDPEPSDQWKVRPNKTGRYCALCTDCPDTIYVREWSPYVSGRTRVCRSCAVRIDREEG